MGRSNATFGLHSAPPAASPPPPHKWGGAGIASCLAGGFAATSPYGEDRLEDCFGQALRLFQAWRGHEHDQLVRPGLLEGADPLPRLLRGLDRARPDPWPEVAVVVLQVAFRLRSRLVAQREVRQRPELRFARPAGPVPDRRDPLHHPAQLLRRPAAERVAEAVFGDPGDRALRVPPQDDRDEVSVDRPRGHRLAASTHRLAAPRPVHEVERRVEALAAVVHVEAGDRKVVRPRARPDAQHEPPAGNLIQRRRLLRQQHRLARGGEQDVGHQADPLRRARGRGQRDQLLEAWIGDSPDRAQRGEAESLGTARDLDQQPSVVEALVGVGKPESDLQAPYATETLASTFSSASTLPSLSRICRLALAAMSRSCVTTTMVTWSSRLRRLSSRPSRSSIVVLPLPERPTTATNSPLSMSSVTPSRALMTSEPRL